MSTIQLYPRDQSNIDIIMGRLTGKKPQKVTIGANAVAKKLLEPNPYRHLLIIMNFSGLDLLYGSDNNNVIIPLINNSIHTYKSHLITIYINDIPYNIHHADWGWGLYVTNPNAQEASIIIIEVG
jgi:hypothetical protein